MTVRRLKSLPVAVFSVLVLLFSNASFAQDEHQGDHHEAAAPEEKKGFDATKIIFGHILDAHEFHFLDIVGEDGHAHPVSVPLPVILYSAERGFDVFLSSKLEHGHAIYNGYKLEGGKIIAVNEAGIKDESIKLLDLSMTRNVVQMLLALTILFFIMTSIAKKYKKGIGVTKAPTGLQNAIEPVITFVRDDVAKANLGSKYEKYLPYLLTVFFFILINNIFGLIPGSANVTGNIAVTAVLGVISFLVINISGNKHYWAHIFNPPGVPGFVKPILIVVEFLGIFIKPFALIIRLFANMVAGHIIIICLVSLIFIFGQLSPAIGWGASPVSIGFTVFIYLIEVLVAFLQAYIFTNLTAVFLGMAIEDPHHHDAHAHDTNGHKAEGADKYDDAVMV
ncbi:MAG: F0F1 ATP synthase subunit A [Candidatus Pseudobacter hemicellulosilyticus]|uniref:ATP synthase subunit a n=1 Tax=Candidatus Pseudobacter hemicellulosilyticus TaxID=3121375 RepID=A0AAJ5WU23_9BACT|nr:MAG: F0F1 ATP synthase subunit A [Pseudobacter sp.]